MRDRLFIAEELAVRGAEGRPGAVAGGPLRRARSRDEGDGAGARRVRLPRGVGHPRRSRVRRRWPSPVARSSWPSTAGITHWHLSITHTDLVAIAYVVAEQRPGVGSRAMLPIVTPVEMRAVDIAVADDVRRRYIERAGAAVARAAVRMIGGTYGRTVNVIVGKGNNGADGRVAARRLADRGVKVRVYAGRRRARRTLPPADLVIDAAYGTGFHGTWRPPDVGGAPVLAVDIPSGVERAHRRRATGRCCPPIAPSRSRR